MGVADSDKGHLGLDWSILVLSHSIIRRDLRLLCELERARIGLRVVGLGTDFLIFTQYESLLLGPPSRHLRSGKLAPRRQD